MSDELTTNCGSVLVSNCGTILLACASPAIGGAGAGGRRVRIRVKARSDPDWAWGVYKYPDWAKPKRRE